MGFEGAYGTEFELAELEDLPNQFIGPDSDGLCDLDDIFLRELSEEDDDDALSCDETGLVARLLPVRFVCMMSILWEESAGKRRVMWPSRRWWELE